MANTAPVAKGKVVPLKGTTSPERKWSREVLALGYSMVPSLIFKAQRRLGLNATQLAVLLHLQDYWWDVDRQPTPSKKTLGARLSLSPRHVQRIIQQLEGAGFVRRVDRVGRHGGKMTNGYDLSGLVAKLKELEPDFRQVEEENRKRRRQVARPKVARPAAW